VDKNAATGINASELAKDFVCEHCHYGKEKRQPFPRIDNRSQFKPGEVLHVDLSGQQTRSLSGAEYLLFIQDEATSLPLVYFLKKKSETAQCIQKIITMIETQTGNKVKMFRSENGTEFVNKELTAYLTRKGILHGCSAA